MSWLQKLPPRIPRRSETRKPIPGRLVRATAARGESDALIGFAGPRVTERTVCPSLSPGSLRSEFLLDHGAIAVIVGRRQLRDQRARLLASLQERALSSNDG